MLKTSLVKSIFNVLFALCLVLPNILSAAIIDGVDTKFQFSPDSLDQVLDSTWVFYRNHNYEPMAAYLEAHLSQIEDMDSFAMEIHYGLVMAYNHLNDYDEMFESIVMGLQLAQKVDNHWMLLSLFRELGSFQDDPLDDQIMGLKYMKKALPYLDAVAANSKCGLMMDIGLSSVNAGQLDSAKYYYGRAFEYLAEDSSMTDDVYSFYAPYLLKVGKLDEAEHYLNHTQEAWARRGFKQGYIESSISFAELHFRKENYSEALSYAQEAIIKTKEIDDIFFLESAKEWEAKSLEALGKAKEALESYRGLNELKDSIELILKQQQLDQKRLSYLMSSYEEELAQISAYNSDLSSKMSTSRMAMSGILLTLLLGGFVFYKSMRTKKQRISELNEVLSLSKEEKRKLQKEYLEAIDELEKNRRELTSSALFLEKKDEALKSVRKMLSKIDLKGNAEASTTIKSARKLAESSINIDNNWESFRYFFEQVFPSFFSEIKKTHPDFNQNELRYLSYMKMGLTDKEAARLLGINTASFQKSKYRIKKKLELPKEVSMTDFLDNY